MTATGATSVALRAQLRQPLLRNGYALVASSGLSAVLGMAFWTAAAHRFPPDVVGVSAAMVAALMLLSTLAQLNLSNAMQRFVPTLSGSPVRFVLACYATSCGAALCLAIVYLIGIRWWSPSLGFLTTDTSMTVWFAVSVPLWTVWVLQDGALSAFRRSELVLVKNAVYGVAKLGILLTPALLAPSYAVYLAWTLPIVPIVWVLNLVMVRRLAPAYREANAPVATGVADGPRSIARFVFADYMIALAGTGTISILPLVVLEVEGAAAAAYFAVAWSVAYTLYLVGRGMSVSLLVEGSRSPDRLAEFTAHLLTRTLTILLPLVAAIVLVAPQLLGVFGASYAAEGTTTLRLLTLSMVPALLVIVYGAVERVRGQMARLVWFTVGSNAITLILTVGMLQAYGLTGLGAAWLAGQSLAAAWCAPRLGYTRPQRPGTQLVGGLVRCASTLREHGASRSRHRWLDETFDDVAGTLDLPPRWRVLSVFPTVGEVTVGTVGASGPSAVLKAARSDRGNAALLAAQSTVSRLALDSRTHGWAHLLPRTLGTTQTSQGHLVVVERLETSSGHGAGLSRSTRVQQDLAESALLGAVQDLHRRTARVAVLDEDWVRVWVDDPVQILTAWLQTPDPAATAALQAISDRLRSSLLGSERRIGWVHGDLTLDNAIMEGDPPRVARVLDWELASDSGLGELDEILLHLSVGQRREHRELGDQVATLLCDDEARATPLGDRDLVLLTWLHHVSSVVAKTGRYPPGSVWASRNVAPVLRAVSPDRTTTGPTVAWHRRVPVWSGQPGWTSWALTLAAAAGLWLSALRAVDVRDMTDTGLVSVLPWPAYLGLGILVLGFVRHVVLAGARRPLLLYPLALTALVYMTPLVVYDVPRFSWAWKHIGIVDYISRHGSTDPYIDTLGVYHNWPGFFAANSMLTELAGLESAASYAAWAELGINLLTVAAVLALLSALSTDVRMVAVGGWLFALGNWVGQGYFAPQGVAYVWYLLSLALLLRFFRARDRTEAPSVPQRWRRVALLVLVLVLVHVIISTHQLTPVVTVLTLAGLVLTRELVPRTLPVLAAAGLAAWALYAAAPFTAQDLAETLGAVGAVEDNLNQTLIGYGRVSPGQQLVSLVARALTVGFCLIAGLGAVSALLERGRHKHRARPDRTALVIAGAPLAIVVLSAYGSEVLFRGYLFALPGLAWFAARLLLPARPSTRAAALPLLVVSGLLVGALLVAQFGNDRRYHFTLAEVEASRYVSEISVPGTLLVEGSRNYPSQFLDYENFVYVPITREDWPAREEIMADPVGKLSGWLESDRFAAAYIIITRSQKAESEALGELPAGGLQQIEDELVASPVFDVVFRNEDAIVFALAERTRTPQPEVTDEP